MPQGLGVLDLSLVWRVAMAAGRAAPTRSIWACANVWPRHWFDWASLRRRSRCRALVLRRALQPAVGGRKLVGTAQSWRRVGGVPAVLVHAVILVQCDAGRADRAGQRIRAAAGSDRRYRADALTTVAEEWCCTASRPTGPLHACLLAALGDAFGRIIPRPTG